MACGIFTVSYEIFIIVVYGIFVAACGIVTAACGIFSCGMLDIFNCHRQNLYCGMDSFKLWYVGSFMQHERFFFFFAACGILVAACRSYKLSHVGSLLQHARSFYFWHEESFSCSMWDHFSCDTCDFYCGVWDMCCSIGDHLLQQTRFFYLQHLRSV